MKRSRGNSESSSIARKLLSAFALAGVIVIAAVLLYSLADRFLINPPVNPLRADADSPTKVEKVIQITVKNECGKSDVAMDFTYYLRKRGFDVVETTNGDRFDRKHTAVVNTSGDYENALRVAEALGVKKEYVITHIDPRSYVDVEVLIGQDYQNLKPRMGIE